MNLSKDVEFITAENHERRKWAEEAARNMEQEVPKKNDDMAKVIRTAVLACAMAAGGGATFAGMGITMGHGPTIAMGIVIALIFGGFGLKMEGLYEGGIRHDV